MARTNFSSFSFDQRFQQLPDGKGISDDEVRVLLENRDQQVEDYLAGLSRAIFTEFRSGGIPIYATTTARDADTRTKVTGAQCYVVTGDSLYTWSGSAWVYAGWRTAAGRLGLSSTATTSVANATLTTLATYTTTQPGLYTYAMTFNPTNAPLGSLCRLTVGGVIRHQTPHTGVYYESGLGGAIPIAAGVVVNFIGYQSSGAALNCVWHANIHWSKP